jgi:hypothetical protein
MKMMKRDESKYLPGPAPPPIARPMPATYPGGVGSTAGSPPGVIMGMSRVILAGPISDRVVNPVALGSKLEDIAMHLLSGYVYYGCAVVDNGW